MRSCRVVVIFFIWFRPLCEACFAKVWSDLGKYWLYKAGKTGRTKFVKTAVRESVLFEVIYEDASKMFVQTCWRQMRSQRFRSCCAGQSALDTSICCDLNRWPRDRRPTCLDKQFWSILVSEANRAFAVLWNPVCQKAFERPSVWLAALGLVQRKRDSFHYDNNTDTEPHKQTNVIHMLSHKSCLSKCATVCVLV